MINLTQVILVIVITTLTILLTFIGIQVVYILKDFRNTLRRINKIVDHAEAITAAVAKPITGIGNLVEGIQSSLKLAELLGYVKKKATGELPERTVSPDGEESKLVGDGAAQVLDEGSPVPTPQSGQVTPTSPQSHFPRFFRRSGSPLG